jgi:hypothetical protein
LAVKTAVPNAGDALRNSSGHRRRAKHTEFYQSHSHAILAHAALSNPGFRFGGNAPLFASILLIWLTGVVVWYMSKLVSRSRHTQTRRHKRQD